MLQPGNQGSPLQGTASSQRLEHMVANVATRGYHCKELPVARDWLPLQITPASQRLDLMVPNVTLARNC